MVNDTVYLPATIIKSRPSRAQFERDFLNNHVPDDYITIARKNNDESYQAILVANLAYGWKGSQQPLFKTGR